MSNSPVLLTMLNNMAGGGNLDEALDQHLALNLRVLDLKDNLFGESIENLMPYEAEQIHSAASRRGLRVHTLSTVLFGGDIEQSEASFRAVNMTALQNTLDLAAILNPVQIRLLMASSRQRENMLDSTTYLQECHAWVFDCYREAVDRIHARGYTTVIENEVGNCLFSKPTEIVGFFSLLDRAGRVSLTWDIQNLWQMGTFPSLDVYESLKPLIGMVHVKGGRAEIPGGRLRWRSSLANASWPVLPIVRRAIADGLSPVICLNPSHGERSAVYDYDYQDDLTFLRSSIKEIE